MAIVDGKIRCGRCKVDKDLSDYPPSLVSKGNGVCRPCAREKSKIRYHKNREAMAAYTSNWRRARGPEYSRSVKERYYKKNQRRVTLSRYGLCENSYNALLESQGGGCAICKSTENADGRPLFVDHCHETNLVRGILCNRCNIGIGALRDNSKIVANALSYLIKAHAPGGL